jgi:hypothetical protein
LNDLFGGHALHPGCTCYYCQLARETKRLQEALQTAYAENQARQKELRELKQCVRNLGEQVGLLNQQVVGLIRQGNERRDEEPETELYPSRDDLKMAGPWEGKSE